MTTIEKYKSTIQSLCDKYKVKELYAFGSVLTLDFNERSDIDFLVDFKKQDSKSYTDNYFNLKFSLEELLKRPVDLLEMSAIKNPWFQKAIENKRQLVYAH